ncbi:MAG: response regulator, partial [Bacteroidaceae bacterium]|nr:response regulator [Bacteroidaceae bacterium]
SELKVESVYGEGSTFSFTLTQGIANSEPVGNFNDRLATLATGYQYTTSFEAPDAHFLVVDDNAMNRKVAVALLKESKVKVTEASSGREALRLVQNRHYDMIFMDHMMPGMDGIETFKAMFSLPDNKCLDTPVIALTANAVAGAKERYLALGFSGFLSKPIIPSQLEKVIKDFLPDTLLVTHKANDLEEVRANRISKVELPDVEGIDWDYALLHFPDESLVFQTAIDFYNGIAYEKEELLALFAAMETEDKPIDDYRIKVHAIKSMANTIGATSLGALAKTLEYAARDGKTDRITLLTPVLVEELELMEHRLRVQLGSQIQKPAIEDLGELFAMLEMLKMAILTKDTEAADNSMQLIRGYSYEADTQSQIDILDKHIMNMEY